MHVLHGIPKSHLLTRSCTEQISDLGKIFHDSQIQCFSEMSPNPNVMKGSKKISDENITLVLNVQLPFIGLGFFLKKALQ